MNLQSPTQLPANAPATNNTNTSLGAGQAAGVRPVAGASLGVDFAQIMARQFERLPSLQKQQLADSSGLAGAAQALNSVNDNTADRRDAAALQDNPPPVASDVPPTGVTLRDGASATPTSNEASSASTGQPHKDNPKSKTTASTTITPVGLALNLPAAMPAVAPLVASTTASATDAANANSASIAVDALNGAQTTAASSASGHAPVMAQAMLSNPWLKDVALISSKAQNKPNTANAELKTVALSPKLNIVTPANTATSPESLTAFAQSMGLDDSAISKLLNPNSVQASASPAGFNPTGLASSLAAASPDGSRHNAASAQSAVTQLAAMGVTSAAMSQNSAVNAQAALQQAQINAPAPGNPLDGASNVALNPQAMAVPSEMIAAAQSTTVANASPAFTNASVSTVDALQMINTGISATDVAALSASLSAGDLGGNASNQQGSGFGQNFAAMSAPTNATNSADVNSAEASASASDTKMQEVYDQLSDKLATEMATRMHKQLSDGQWKMKFGLRPANLGGVEVQLEMKDGKLNASFNVDNPLTAHLLQNAAARLRESLGNFGIQAGQVQIGQNATGNPQGSSQGNSQQSTSQPQVMENSSRLDNVADESQSDNPVKSSSDGSSNLDLYA